MCGLQARHWNTIIFEGFTIYISTRFGKFQVVPEKFHFLEEIYLEKLQDLAKFASFLGPFEAYLGDFWEKTCSKKYISLKLLGILKSAKLLKNVDKYFHHQFWKIKHAKNILKNTPNDRGDQMHLFYIYLFAF